MSDEQNLVRREWLRGVCRNLILGTMLAGVGILSARRGDGCPRDSLCSGCPALRGCDLPPARKSRLKAARKGR